MTSPLPLQGSIDMQVALIKSLANDVATKFALLAAENGKVTNQTVLCVYAGLIVAARGLDNTVKDLKNPDGEDGKYPRWALQQAAEELGLLPTPTQPPAYDPAREPF